MPVPQFATLYDSQGNADAEAAAAEAAAASGIQTVEREYAREKAEAARMSDVTGVEAEGALTAATSVVGSLRRSNSHGILLGSAEAASMAKAARSLEEKVGPTLQRL